MWFSPIKGHYPSLGQIDKTLPVQTGDANKKIERGTIIELTTSATNADGEFKIAADATNDSLLYISLQRYEDAQAGMAGSTGFDGNVPAISEGNINIPGVTAGVPAITGLSLSMEGEYETDMFTGLESASVGDPLTVSNGHFTVASGSDKVVAILTGTPYSRWVNNAPAKWQGSQVVRQGANVTVIRFRTK